MSTSVDELLPTRDLKPGQRTEVWIADVVGGSSELIYTSHHLLLEAPNWAPDGNALLLNGHGLLWRLNLEPEVTLEQVVIDDLPPINNDHVLDAPRGLIYLSANDGHLYVAPIAGGRAIRISHDPTRYHFLHGVSPDGTILAFVDLPRGDFTAAGRLAVIPAAGGETRYPAAGTRHIDGPEYSADGEWIYLNTEEFGVRPGHAQLARVPAQGGSAAAPG
jgi:TolB protein